MSEVYIFYRNRNETGDSIETDGQENFAKVENGILQTCYYFLDYIEPLAERDKGEKIQKLLEDYSNKQYSSILRDLGVEEHYHNDLLEGKYRPCDLSALFKEMNLGDSSLFIKQIEKDYLVVTQQYPKTLKDGKAAFVLSAILKTLEKKKNINIYECDFYIFFHATHIGRFTQSSPDLLFNVKDKKDFKKKVEEIVKHPGEASKRINIQEIVSFKHLAHGKTLSILKSISSINDVEEIKKKLNFGKHHLVRFQRLFLPLLIDIKGVMELEKMGLDAVEYKKSGKSNMVDLCKCYHSIIIDFNAYLEKYWKKGKIGEEFQSLKNYLKDRGINTVELEQKVDSLKKCEDYKVFEKILNSLIAFLEEIKQ